MKKHTKTEQQEIRMLCIKTKLVLYDLKYVDKQLEKHKIKEYQFYAALKQLFVTLDNIKGIISNKTLYEIIKKDESILSLMRKNRKDDQFYNHLRNKIGGHLSDSVIRKTIQWHPEIFSEGKTYRKDTSWAINFFLLEMAVNTYVDKDGNHKIFKYDLDFMIQSGKFFEHLENFVSANIKLLNKIQNKLFTVIDRFEIISWEDLIKEASKTNFFIKKKLGK